MKYLCLDFETQDSYISRGLGGGWVFAIDKKDTKGLFKILGFSYCIIDTTDNINTISSPSYLSLLDQDNLTTLEQLTETYNRIVFHNATYDLGCLAVLGMDITGITVLDTKIVANLYDNNQMSYKLDALAVKYLGKKKEYNLLINLVKKHFPLQTKKGKMIGQQTKTYNNKCLKYAYDHMEDLQIVDFEGIAEYAKMDVQLTAELFLYYCGETNDV